MQAHVFYSLQKEECLISAVTKHNAGSALALLPASLATSALCKARRCAVYRSSISPAGSLLQLSCGATFMMSANQSLWLSCCTEHCWQVQTHPVQLLQAARHRLALVHSQNCLTQLGPCVCLKVLWQLWLDCRQRHMVIQS